MADILPELTAMKSKQHTRPLSRRLPLKPMLLLLPGCSAVRAFPACADVMGDYQQLRV